MPIETYGFPLPCHRQDDGCWNSGVKFSKRVERECIGKHGPVAMVFAWELADPCFAADFVLPWASSVA